MPWNSTYPLGSVSVSANRTIGQQNTSYIETTMGNSIVGTNTTTTRDHFWDVGTNEDGRHRFINSPAFTVGLVPADPVVGTGMDAVLYLKVTNGRPEWFHRTNVVGAPIFQVTPTYLIGTVVLNSSYVTVVTVPEGVFGEIFMSTVALGRNSSSTGFFRTNTGVGAVASSWAYLLAVEGSASGVPVKYANGADASGLNIRARAEDATNGQTWHYRIMYRSL